VKELTTVLPRATDTALAVSHSATLEMAPGANLAAYVQAVSAIPMLSAEREQALAEKLFYEGCVASARELVLLTFGLLYTLRAATLVMGWPKPI